MDELLKRLETAYRMISYIPVSGDAVDMMATARSNLRKVYAELKEKQAEGENTDGTAH